MIKAKGMATLRAHPEIEVITPDKVNQAIERVLISDVRYRFVIDMHDFL